jgi:hypothetical protein
VRNRSRSAGQSGILVAINSFRQTYH